MSSIPNNNFSFDKINPSYKVDSENLFTAEYGEEKRLLNEANQLKKISELRSLQETIVNNSKTTIEDEEQFYIDYNQRFERYIQENSLPSYYASDFENAIIESRRELVQRHTDFTATELMGTAKVARAWEANQMLMLEGNLDDSVLTVALMDEDVSRVNPKNIGTSSFFNDVTFTRSSIWGKVFDKNSPNPQTSELIATNAQTMKYMALRWRGGKNGTLWNEANENSQYLKQMFVEDPTTKAFLDEWTLVTPSLLSLEGATDFAWTGKNIFDMLSEAPVPDNIEINGELVKWDPKIAIEEIKRNSPKLAYVLFERIGLTEEQLTDPEVSKNPQMFKFFIADTIDAYASGVITQAFNQNSSWYTNLTMDFALPVIRDSLNSNDTLAELGLTALGIAATAGGGLLTVPTLGGTAPVAVGGAVATATGVASFASRVARIGRASSRLRTLVATTPRFASTLRSGSIALERLSKVNNLGLKTAVGVSKVVSQVYRFAPHNAGETILGLTKNTKFGKVVFWMEDEIPWNEAFKQSKTTLAKTFGKYTARSIVNGAGQGAIEDALRQHQAQSAGFQSDFSWKALGSNMIEEGLGEIALGGLFNGMVNFKDNLAIATGNRIEFLDKLNVKLGSGKLRGAALAQYKKLPIEVRRRIEIGFATLAGVDSKDYEGMDFNQRVDFQVNAINLNFKLEGLGQITNFGNFVFKPTKDSFIDNLLIAAVNGDSDAINDSMRLDLATTLLSVHERTKTPDGNSTLSQDEWETLAYASLRDRIIFNDSLDPAVKEAIVARLNNTMLEATFRTRAWKDKDGNKLDITWENVNDYANKDELLESVVKSIQEREEKLKTVLFGSSDEENVNRVNGIFVSSDDIKVIESLAAQFAKDNKTNNVRVTGVGVGVNGVTVNVDREFEELFAMQPTTPVQPTVAPTTPVQPAVAPTVQTPPSVSPPPTNQATGITDEELDGLFGGPVEPEPIKEEPKPAQEQSTPVESKPETTTDSDKSLTKQIEDRENLNMVRMLESGSTDVVKQGEEDPDALDFIKNLGCELKGDN